MSVLARVPARNRHYPSSYSSSGVGDDASEFARPATPPGGTVSSIAVTVDQRQGSLFHDIVNARASADRDDWDGEGSPPISEGTVVAAIQLLYALPEDLPPPEVAPESTAEISFEWYRDRRHVAVLSVDDTYIRWSAITGTDSIVSGSEPFTRTVPGPALDAIRAVVG